MKNQELNPSAATTSNAGVPLPSLRAISLGRRIRGIQRRTNLKRRAGKIKYGCLAWLIGLPLPIVIILLFYKGCDF